MCFPSAGVSGREFLLQPALFVQPLIDCAVCYKTLREEIEPQPKPYVHCIPKTALTQVRPLLLSTLKTPGLWLLTAGPLHQAQISLEVTVDL